VIPVWGKKEFVLNRGQNRKKKVPCSARGGKSALNDRILLTRKRGGGGRKKKKDPGGERGSVPTTREGLAKARFKPRGGQVKKKKKKKRQKEKKSRYLKMCIEGDKPPQRQFEKTGKKRRGEDCPTHLHKKKVNETGAVVRPGKTIGPTG